MENHRNYRPTYDYVADPEKVLDGAIVSEVIAEAEGITREASENRLQRAGRQAMRALHFIGDGLAITYGYRIPDKFK